MAALQDKSTVVECLLVNDQVSMRESWNGDAYSNKVIQNVSALDSLYMA